MKRLEWCARRSWPTCSSLLAQFPTSTPARYSCRWGGAAMVVGVWIYTPLLLSGLLSLSGCTRRSESGDVPMPVDDSAVDSVDDQFISIRRRCGLAARLCSNRC